MLGNPMLAWKSSYDSKQLNTQWPLLPQGRSS